MKKKDEILNYIGGIQFPATALAKLKAGYPMRFDGVELSAVQGLAKDINKKDVQRSMLFKNHENERFANLLQYEFNCIKAALLKHYINIEKDDVAKAYFLKVQQSSDQMSSSLFAEEAAVMELLESKRYRKTLLRKLLSIAILFPDVMSENAVNRLLNKNH